MHGSLTMNAGSPLASGTFSADSLNAWESCLLHRSQVTCDLCKQLNALALRMGES